MVTGIDIDIRVPPEFPEKYRDALVRSPSSAREEAHGVPPRFSVRTVTTD